MSLVADTRIGALDAVLDEERRPQKGLVDRLLRREPDAPDTLAEDLFAATDLLDTSIALRRALSDPGSPEDARRGLVHGLFDGKLSAPAVTVVAEASAMRWSGGRTLVAALERQAVRAELYRADEAGQLEETEDELFRFSRLVESNPGLREVLADRTVDVSRREVLVDELLSGKAGESTIKLAKRAVSGRDRSFARTIEGYVELAAAHKNRMVATVRVAKPMSEEQISRLQAALTRQAGRPIFVQVVLDEQVIGGMRVELGDEVIEGTVAAKLEEARRLFL